MAHIGRSAVLTVVVATVAGTFAAGCGPGFRTADFPTPVALYDAALEQYRLGKWENAVTAFEQVTLQLAARDTLLPRAHYYLALAHGQRKDHQLAAVSFMRLYEGFPADTLADDGLLGAALSHERSWRGPEYDPEFAQRALEAYALFQRLYSASPLVKDAQEGEARMNEGLAKKELSTGMYYYRRRAWDSALLYFGYSFADYPGTPSSREARMMMVRVYQRLGYREDIGEHCRALRAEFPNAADVRQLCGTIVADASR